MLRNGHFLADDDIKMEAGSGAGYVRLELNMMLLRWEGMKKCIEFWIKVIRMDDERKEPPTVYI